MASLAPVYGGGIRMWPFLRPAPIHSRNSLFVPWIATGAQFRPDNGRTRPAFWRRMFDCKRRRLLLKDIVTGVAISPWASEAVVNEVKADWASIGDIKLPIHHVSSSLIPSPEDLAIYGGIGHLPHKAAAVIA